MHPNPRHSNPASPVAPLNRAFRLSASDDVPLAESRRLLASTPRPLPRSRRALVLRATFCITTSTIPNASLLGGTATPCAPWIRGLLQRRHIVAGSISYCGEEFKVKLEQGPVDHDTDVRCKIYEDGQRQILKLCGNWLDTQSAKSRRSRDCIESRFTS
jgi:hypothetical protein